MKKDYQPKLEMDIFVEYNVYIKLKPYEKCLLYNLINIFVNSTYGATNIILKESRIADKWICVAEKKYGYIKHYIDITEFDKEEWNIIGKPNFDQTTKYQTNMQENKLYIGAIIYPNYISTHEEKHIRQEWCKILDEPVKKPITDSTKTNIEMKSGRIKWWNQYVYGYGLDKNDNYDNDIHYIPSKPMSSLCNIIKKLKSDSILNINWGYYKFSDIIIEQKKYTIPLVCCFEAAVEYINNRASLSAHYDDPYYLFKICGINIDNDVRIRYLPKSSYCNQSGGRGLVNHLFSYIIRRRSCHILLPFNVCHEFKHQILSNDVIAPRLVILLRQIPILVVKQIIKQFVIKKLQTTFSNKYTETNIQQIINIYSQFIMKNYCKCID